MYNSRSGIFVAAFLCRGIYGVSLLSSLPHVLSAILSFVSKILHLSRFYFICRCWAHRGGVGCTWWYALYFLLSIDVVQEVRCSCLLVVVFVICGTSMFYPVVTRSFHRDRVFRNYDGIWKSSWRLWFLVIGEDRDGGWSHEESFEWDWRGTCFHASFL